MPLTAEIQTSIDENNNKLPYESKSDWMYLSFTATDALGVSRTQES